MVRTLCGGSSDKSVVIGLPADFDLDKQLRSAKEVFLATAFATTKGWKIIKDALLKSEAEINIVTGLYYCHTEPKLLWEWLGLASERPDFYVRLAASPKANQHGTAVFHPKVLIVCGENGRFAIVGSGNLTSGGLRSNVECSIYTEAPAHVDALLEWFDELECDTFSERAILKYEPHYDQAAPHRKALEEDQETAEQDIKSEISFMKRRKAIQEARAYFGSKEFTNTKSAAERARIIPDFRRLLNYDAFNFGRPAWEEFYKHSGLGKIREGHLTSTVENLDRIRQGLRFLFAKEQEIGDRLHQLMEDGEAYRVCGIGRNLISKFLAAHDPKMWFVYNGPVVESLESFGYLPKGSDTEKYLTFAKEMRSFKDECGAEDCVALDAFFKYWSVQCKKNAK